PAPTTSAWRPHRGGRHAGTVGPGRDRPPAARRAPPPPPRPVPGRGAAARARRAAGSRGRGPAAGAGPPTGCTSGAAAAEAPAAGRRPPLRGTADRGPPPLRRPLVPWRSSSLILLCAAVVP